MRSVHHTINRSGVRLCASPRSSVSSGVKGEFVRVQGEHSAQRVGLATLDLVCDDLKLSFLVFARKAPCRRRGWLRWFCKRLALFRRRAPTAFLTRRRSRGNCHCASCSWTLGLLAVEVLRRFCSQQSAPLSSPFNEGLMVLPGLECVKGWGIPFLVSIHENPVLLLSLRE